MSAWKIIRKLLGDFKALTDWLTLPMVAMMCTNGEAVLDKVAPLVEASSASDQGKMPFPSDVTAPPLPDENWTMLRYCINNLPKTS